MTIQNIYRILTIGLVAAGLTGCGADNFANKTSTNSASNLLSTAKSEGAAAYDQALNPPTDPGNTAAGFPTPTHQLARLDPSVLALFQQHLSDAVTRLEVIITKVQGFDVSNLPPEVAGEKDKILQLLNDRLACLKLIVSQIPVAANPQSATVNHCPSGVDGGGRILCPTPLNSAGSVPPELVKPPIGGVDVNPNSVDPSGLKPPTH